MDVQAKAKKFGEIIAQEVTKLHEISPRGLPAPAKGKRKRRWDAVAGQFLVYGLERQIGFGRGVDLCSVVERAWTTGASVEQAAADLYMSWFPETAAKESNNG